MSVESEILRIQHNIANTYAAVSEKGGEVPLQPTSANLAAAVASIPAASDIISGDGLTKEGSALSVTTPVRGIYTQTEFDALPEEQQNKGMYVVKEEGDGGGWSGGGGGVPSGFIGMWSGQTVPDGWLLCDGTNGTPDLRGRFILGSSASHALGETGGSETVTLTKAQMPLHEHSYEKGFWQNFAVRSGTLQTVVSASGTKLESSLTNQVGGGGAHNNMPPYYVLAFIMKQ